MFRLSTEEILFSNNIPRDYYRPKLLPDLLSWVVVAFCSIEFRCMLGMNKAICLASSLIGTLFSLWKTIIFSIPKKHTQVLSKTQARLYLFYACTSILLYTLLYISMVFNQGAVMQPVQSSPLNMYTNNNVLMPATSSSQKTTTMQNQDPFGSLLWWSWSRHTPYTSQHVALHLFPLL